MSKEELPDRRTWINAAIVGGSALSLRSRASAASEKPARKGAKKGGKEEQEVAATEDLMREHGVLRRALLVYRESASKLRHNASAIDPAALRQTAQLFREFGEEYQRKEA